MLPSSPSLSTVISLPSLNFRSSLRLGLALPSPRPKLFAVAAIGASVGSAVTVCRRLEPPKPLPVALSPLKYQSWEWKSSLHFSSLSSLFVQNLSPCLRFVGSGFLLIKYRWNALPAEQRDGMKNYIS
ncbi:hypothetical protein Scep_025791 [Stephania cephalantha]|uniref:Uncharacterized protein n=1 Tax=Stephania cephalantha TaxID=152367 RepID=A0AAP0EP48_9MAGN